jgi:hypothetical protein
MFESKRNQIILILLFFSIIINSKILEASAQTGVEYNVNITILSNGDAIFSSIRSLEIQDKNIVGNFLHSIEPVNKDIIPSSIVVYSNRGILNYSLSNGVIDIFSENGIKYENSGPLIIHLEYRIKNFLEYDNQEKIYYIFQPFLQYNVSSIPKFYNLSVTIYFPFDLYPISGPAYIPFLCYHNQSLNLLQITPPILQYNKNLTTENEDLYIEDYFDILQAPPKMKIEVFENLNLDTAKYTTKTRATNLYPYELCYTLTKNSESYSLEITNCTEPSGITNIPNFYHINPGGTSSDFNDEGFADKKSCSDSLFENFYPLECYIITKQVPITTEYFPEKMQKDFNVQYSLDMNSEKGFEIKNDSNTKFELSLLPSIINLPNIPSFDCQIFKPLDYPSLEEKEGGYYHAQLETKIFQPTIVSFLRYDVPISRTFFGIWIPLSYSFLSPILAYIGWKIKRNKGVINLAFDLLLFGGVFAGLYGICAIFGAKFEDMFQLKSLPLIIFSLIWFFILLYEMSKKKKH